MAKAKKEEDTIELKPLSEYGEIEFITTGIKEVDEVVKLPKARITEIYGLQGIGKSYLMTKCVSEISKVGKVLYIDAESAINPSRMLEMGGVGKNIVISTEPVLEAVAELVIKNVDKYDVIVVDSIAALIPKSEFEGETGDQFVGLKARLMGQWMRKLIGPLGKSKCAVVFINQMRESMSMYVSKFTPGGKALPYAASLRLELKTASKDKIIKKGEVAGHWVTAEVTKSRVCKPHQSARFELLY